MQGIRVSHQEFRYGDGAAGQRAAEVYTSLQSGATGQDCNGHGTHVAAAVAGLTFGVAKNASLLAVRSLECMGNGTVSQVRASDNATPNPASLHCHPRWGLSGTATRHSSSWAEPWGGQGCRPAGCLLCSVRAQWQRVTGEAVTVAAQDCTDGICLLSSALCDEVFYAPWTRHSAEGGCPMSVCLSVQSQAASPGLQSVQLAAGDPGPGLGVAALHVAGTNMPAMVKDV